MYTFPWTFVNVPIPGQFTTLRVPSASSPMSKFPSIEEFDSGQITATKLDDDFLRREQAVLGDDAAFFQSAPVIQTESFMDAGVLRAGGSTDSR
jgi:Clathrin light chain